MTFTYLFLSFTLHLVKSSAAADWCYDIQTKSNADCPVPSKWKDANEYCGKDKQSPINIVTCNAKYNSKMKPFTFQGYDKENTFQLGNTGHSAELSLEGQQTIQISGGGLSGTYKALQLHFHWGSKDNFGSEHSLNGERYPIELHIVHEKVSQRSEPSGGSTSGELAVLGFFYTEGPFNANYNNLITGFSSITLKGNKTSISKVKLQDLIPKAENLKLFYRYEGSLTTPLCNETVTWTVFPAAINLSREQINDFYTKLKYSDNQVMNENFRPIQNPNGRIVYTSGVDIILPHTRYLLILFAFYLTAIS